jgi:hypothetical protein
LLKSLNYLKVFKNFLKFIKTLNLKSRRLTPALWQQYMCVVTLMVQCVGLCVLMKSTR